MNRNNNPMLAARRAILSYLKDRLDASAISTAAAAKVVRRELSSCRLTDAELTKLIADTAIEAGFGVSFDLFDNDNGGKPK